MTHRAHALALAAASAVVLAQLSSVLWPANAAGAHIARAARIAPAGPAGTGAPTPAPLLSAGAPRTTVGAEEDQGAGVEGEADPLVSNGLGSPTCTGALSGELSATSRSHCETSGFVAAPAPTGDYGIDVHIDTGLLGFSAGALQSAVQDLLLSPLWNVLVWMVHALVVMLEWCFTVDLLDSPAAGSLARGLRRAQASFTEPWLVLALAMASVFAVYRGLIRRRVADTLGDLLVMGAMMVAGLWVIADPTGSVGALGEWANQAGLGTMAVAASGTPSTPARTLGDSLDTVFATAIEGPWCYMEFGDVGWCREPARLQRSLRTAGLAIAAQELTRAGCSSSSGCAAAGSSARALQRSAEMLRAAHSNGAIFLALPADGPARNSINETGSLLRTICQSAEAANCRGPAAAQAEFRTGAHTWERASGLLLIVVGLLGMLLLFGFLALRLLVAAVFSLLYLLLAPAVVLAPAFGESGRALFRRWAAELLGAVVSKLLFSFLLGAVLAVLGILSDLTAIGWWTQWLLMSAFWWGAFMRRHHALDVIGGAVGRENAPRDSVTRFARQALAKRGVNDTFDRVKQKWNRPPPPVPAGEQPQRRRPRDTQRKPRVESQAVRSLGNEHRRASARSKHAGRSARLISDMSTRLARVRVERQGALAAGDRRRAASLEHRGNRIANEIEREQTALDAAKRIAGTPAGAFVRDNRGERERFLDAQAALPSSARANPRAAQRRDYAALAGLAGHDREHYEGLAAPAQRAARLEIDRELARRSELGQRLGGSPQRDQAPPGRSPSHAPRERANTADRSAREQIDPELIRAARESPIMRDAREVEAGRKRQLGKGRP